MKDNHLTQLLSTALVRLNIDPDISSQLLDFVHMLAKWNKTYNITAIRDLEQMVILHVIDSASVYRYLKGNSIIDVGTGGGIPGIIFAIINPALKITLLDSNQKKMRFLRYAQRDLKIKNITIVCERVEEFKPQSAYDVVISRAFTEVGNFLSLSGHLCKQQGEVLAMKGPRIESEKNVAEIGFELIEDLDIQVPFLDADRRLLVFKKT